MRKRTVWLLVSCLMVVTLVLASCTTTPSNQDTSQPTELSIQIVSVTQAVSPGENATLIAETTPGANCDIEVYYKSGPSEASGLYPKTADSDGYVSWTWMVGTNTTPGSWEIVVSASYDSQTASDSTYFTVEAEPALPELFLNIVSVTSPIGQGYTATLQAKTLPGAYCTITVYYKSGPSEASGLYPKEADSQGNVSWSWKVGTRTTPGSWEIVVSASYDSQTSSDSTYFTVLD